MSPGLVYFSTTFSVSNGAELNDNLYLVFFVWVRWVLDLTGGESRSVPQRLKPHCKQETYGTAEAMPLTKPSFSAASFRLRRGEVPLTWADGQAGGEELLALFTESKSSPVKRKEYRVSPLPPSTRCSLRVRSRWRGWSRGS